MYSHFTIFTKYLRYLFSASNAKGHGIHSPFVFDFVSQVLRASDRPPEFKKIEAMRSRLLHDHRLLDVEDFGAGSGVTHKKRRRISSIARHAAKPKKYGQLLFRIARHYRSDNMLELGTSLGLSTAYLAAANRTGRVITVEGSASVAEAAAQNLHQLGFNNIRLVQGDFDSVLPGLLDDAGEPDLAFVDGNHRKEPTVAYFNLLRSRVAGSAILIFDDIHWSRDMEAAWTHIKNDAAVMLSVDLFFVGIVFFSDAFKVKQHFVIRY